MSLDGFLLLTFQRGDTGLNWIVECARPGIFVGFDGDHGDFLCAPSLHPPTRVGPIVSLEGAERDRSCVVFRSLPRGLRAHCRVSSPATRSSASLEVVERDDQTHRKGRAEPNTVLSIVVVLD